jgi:hypothetical protein
MEKHNFNNKCVIGVKIPPDVSSEEMYRLLQLVGVSPATMDSRNPPNLYLTFDEKKKHGKKKHGKKKHEKKKHGKKKHGKDILAKLNGLRTKDPLKETRTTMLKKTIVDTAKLLSSSQAKQYLLQLHYHVYPRNLFTDEVKEMIFWI